MEPEKGFLLRQSARRSATAAEGRGTCMSAAFANLELFVVKSGFDDRVVELTRFRGHLTLLGGGIHDAAIKTTVSTGVS
jgi:hypothetical protein